MNESQSQAAAATETVLIFRVGEALHAIPVESVEEVLPALPLEVVPQCPRFVEGVIFVRGHLIPVLGAAERLQLENRQAAEDPHIIALRTGGRLVGLQVDEALDLMELPTDQMLPADKIAAGNEFLQGLIDHQGRVIRLLNPERLIAGNEEAQLKHVPRTRSP